MEMRLRALLVASAEFPSWAPSEAVQTLKDTPAVFDLPDPGRAAAVLETVRIQLEAGSAGSRFPLLWRLGFALAEERAHGWANWEIEPLIGEIAEVEGQFAALPVRLAASLAFGEDGSPEIYFRTCEWLGACNRQRGTVDPV